jgi:hypothetical protein
MSKFKTSRDTQQPGRRWRQWKEPDARKALAAWRRSGLSAGAFSARAGYSETRLRYWSERLRAEPSPRSSPVSFVPVALSNAPREHHIEIERGGVVLRVREELDVEHVARLVAALAGVEPTC